MSETPADKPGRGLGVADASLIVVGNIVGAGIFLVSPYVAQGVKSPFAFLSVWVLGGAVALAGALANGELGGLFPRSGGEYVYLREAYGPSFGFLSGWTSFWIGFPGSIAALASGFGATMAAMCGLSRPSAATGIGVAAIVVLTLVNATGMHTAKWTQNVLSATKLVAFAVLLTLGVLVARGAGPDGAHGFLREDFFRPGDRVMAFAGALVPVMFAYTGWNAATYVAGEMRDPARGLGRALAIGTALCVVLYVAINVVYLRAMPLAELATTSDPARASAATLGGATAATLLSPLVAVCVCSSLHATMLVGPSIYLAMAGDGLFFAPFGRLHAQTRVPIVGLLAQAAVAIALLVSGSFDQLLTFTMFAIVSFSMLTVAAVFILRVRRPEAPRPFRVPGYPWAPALFVVVSGWVLWSIVARGAREAFIGLAIVASGVPACILFRLRAHSRDKGTSEA
jgi:basic amino acid/polyamine antiporter, APA family